MKKQVFAVLGDIHGNLEALEAVIKDSREQGATHYVSVGDLVGYNADPSKCMSIVREIATAVVRGNHDHYCSHNESLDDFHPLAANVVDWTRGHLKDEQVQYLRSLKMHRMCAGFTLVHSTLDMPSKWGYVFDCLEADAHFNYQTTSLCFYGHTHVPMCFEKNGRIRQQKYTRVKIMLGNKYFINVGSVGQPRDGDPRAAYVLYDLSARVVELRRIPYNISKTQAKIRKAGLPERLARRLEIGK